MPKYDAFPEPEPESEVVAPAIPIPTLPADLRLMVVGVSEYQRMGEAGFPPLPEARDSADNYASMMFAQGAREIQLRTMLDRDVLAESAFDRIRDWLGPFDDNDVGPVVLFWAGHQVPNPDMPADPVLVCFDTQPEKLAATGVSIARIVGALNPYGTRKVVVIADPSGPPPEERRLAREFALQLAYALRHRPPSEDPRLTIELVETMDELPRPQEQQRQFARALALAATEHTAAIDEVIRPALQNWRLERLADIDLLILRLAVAEMRLDPSKPYRVVLNEFIEIAKDFGSEETPRFVNGVLDGIVRRLNPGDVKPAPRGRETKPKSRKPPKPGQQRQASADAPPAQTAAPEAAPKPTEASAAPRQPLPRISIKPRIAPSALRPAPAKGTEGQDQ